MSGMVAAVLLTVGSVAGSMLWSYQQSGAAREWNKIAIIKECATDRQPTAADQRDAGIGT